MLKNIRYYKWIFYDEKDILLTNKKSKILVNRIIKENSIENSVLLKEKKTDKKNDRNIYLDVIKNNDDFLFGKISKSKFRHDIQKRNEKDKKTGDVLADDERDKFSIELTSYFLYNYETQIILFIYTTGAGSINNLDLLISSHSQKYATSIAAIINKDILEQVLNCTYLKGIDITIASPNSEFLTSDLIHIKDEAALALQQSKIAEISMQIKPERGDSLVIGQQAKVILKGIVDSVKKQKKENPKKRQIRKIKITSKDSSQKMYSGVNLYEDDFILEYEFEIEDIKEKTNYFNEIYSCLETAYYDNIETVKIYC